MFTYSESIKAIERLRKEKKLPGVVVFVRLTGDAKADAYDTNVIPKLGDYLSEDNAKAAVVSLVGAGDPKKKKSNKKWDKVLERIGKAFKKDLKIATKDAVVTQWVLLPAKDIFEKPTTIDPNDPSDWEKYQDETALVVVLRK